MVKLSLKLNTNEILTYFCYEVDDARALLAIIKIYEVFDPGEVGAWPYRTKKSTIIQTVVNVNNIIGIVWSIESSSKRHYLCTVEDPSRKKSILPVTTQTIIFPEMPLMEHLSISKLQDL
ncbi:hypothetical protein BDA99DRAFT_542790 [Phascolomyces articulosus]|uniref:Uncharacterized protein n=1 Tax=Phascolomyces articulosus TaxID=60185 RepID=A0AAD5JZ33_9FUNG|nr:hypothetical protein BDA99DRAFT_542790 [Phascolomyces articulosus]